MTNHKCPGGTGRGTTHGTGRVTSAGFDAHRDVSRTRARTRLFLVLLFFVVVKLQNQVAVCNARGIGLGDFDD